MRDCLKKMLALLLSLCLLCGTMLTVSAQDTEDGAASAPDATRIQIPWPGEGEDASPAIQEAIAQAEQVDGPVCLEFEEGKTYHIFPETAYHKMNYYVSNAATKSENANGERWSAIFMKGMSDVTVEGNQAMLMIHGVMTPILLDECENITFQNLHVDWARPTMSEFTIKEVGDNYADIQVNESSLYEIAGNQLRWVSEKKPDGSYYWTLTGGLCVVYDPVADTARSSGFTWGNSIEELDNGLLRLHYNSRPNLTVGQTYQFRSGSRDQVGSFIHRCKDVVFQDMGFHYMHGLGIVAQYTENITFTRMDCTPRPETGRTCASSADFMQISGCRGLVSITDSTFRGSHDDVFNIHGTHLRIVEKDEEANTITVRFMQERSWGFQAFNVGDEIEFVRPDTMLNYASNRVKSFERLDDYRIRLTLEDPLPADISVNADVVENITYTPDVYIARNKAYAVTTRGLLCTTRGEVLIEDNLFYKMGMSGVLLEDDVRQWFESGPIKNMTIRNNEFVECGGPVIFSNPQTSVYDPEKTVHSNITIEGNTFTGNSHIKMMSTRNITIRNNTFDDGGRVELVACKDFLVEGNNNLAQSAITASNSLDDRSLASVSLAVPETVETLDRTGMTVTATSQRTGYETAKMLDGDKNSIWHTDWDNPPETVELTVNLNGEKTFNRVAYLPRQNGELNGMFTRYELWVSNDGTDYRKIAEGEWPANQDEKYILLDEPVTASFVRIVAPEVVKDSSGRICGSCAELNFQLYQKQMEELPVGRRLPLEITAVGLTGAPALLPEGAVTCTSDNEAVVRMDGDVVCAAGPGKATVTVTVEAYGKKFTDSVVIQVSGEVYHALTSVSVREPGTVTGPSLQLEADIEPAEAAEDLAWSVETLSGSAASIQDGVLSASGSGRYLVTAYSLNDPSVRDQKMIVSFEQSDAGDTWQVVRENRAALTLTDEGGLKVTSGKGGLWAQTNNAPNVITTAMPQGDAELIVQLDYATNNDYAEAGILFYGDDDNYVYLSRKMHSGYGGHIFSMITEVGGNAAESPASVKVMDTIDGPVWLKLVRTGNSYSGYVSADKEQWTPVWENRTLDFAVELRAGVLAYNSGSGSDTATYSPMQLNGQTIAFNELFPAKVYETARLTASAPNAMESVCGTAWEALGLPRTLSLTWNDSYRDVSGVQWNSDGFQAGVTGQFSLTGMLTTVPESLQSSYTAALTLTVKADLTALNALVEQAAARQEAAYTPESWAVFSQALSDAWDVLNTPDVDQTRVDAAAAALTAALDGLTLRAEPAALEALVAQALQVEQTASALTYEESTAPDDRVNGSYSQEKLSALAASREAAQTLLAELSDSLTEEQKVQLAQGAEALNAAIAALEESCTRVDDSTLRTRIEQIREMLAELKEEEYTAASWQSLQNELNEAQALLDTPDARYTAGQMKAAVQELNAAWDGLCARLRVTIGSNEGGSLNAEPIGLVDPGTRVVFRVNVNSGYRLKSLLLNGQPVTAEDGVYVIESLEQDANMVAEFETIPYYTIWMQGGVSQPESKAQPGTLVTVTAQVPAGQRFIGWESSQVSFANASAVTTTFVMPEGDVTVTARYQAESGGSGNTGDSGNSGNSGGTVTVNMDGLRQWVAKAEGLRSGEYTAESWSALYQALENARLYLYNPAATQAQVDAAAAALQKAIDALEPAAGTKTEPDEPSDTEKIEEEESPQAQPDSEPEPETDGSSEPEQPASGETGNSNSQTASTSAGGVSGGVLLAVAAAVLAAAVLLVILIRKKNRPQY